MQVMVGRLVQRNVCVRFEGGGRAGLSSAQTT